MVAIAVLVPLFAQAAEGRKAIRKAEQLVETDKQLKAYEQPYILASSASLIYDHCAADLAITQPERVFLKERYVALSNAYLKAFEDSFVAQWKAPSDAALSKDYVRYLTDVRAPGVARTSKAITTAGCTDRSVKAMVDYYRTIQAAEAKGQKVPLVRTVKKR